jgi:hypothetical protein
VPSLPAIATAQSSDSLGTPAPVPASNHPPFGVTSGRDGIWYGIPLLTGPAATSDVAGTPGPGRFSTDAGVLGARDEHSMILDVDHNRFIVFGGITQTVGPAYNDVWERPVGSTSEWTLMSPSGTPPSPRYGHTAIYDPVRHRMIVFGGTGIAPPDYLWELTLDDPPTWHPMATAGAGPSGRFGHSAVYDAAHDQMIVFAGRTPTLSNETWTLSFASDPPVWQKLTFSTSVPAGRSRHVAVLDPPRNRMVMYGGTGTSRYEDVWTLSLGTTPAWTRVLFFSAIGAREGAGSAYDAAGDRIIVFGGNLSSTYPSDLWALDLASMTWGTLPYTTPPPGRTLAALAIDAGTRTAILQGGVVGTSPSLDDTWQLTVGATSIWQLLLPPPPPPPPPPPQQSLASRYAAGAVFDPVRQSFIELGGAIDNDPIAYLNDVAELVVGRDSGWVALPVSGTFLSRRYGHSAVYDPVRDRIIVFGGYNGFYLGDLWDVRITSVVAGTQLFATGTAPGPRDFHSAIYDPVRDRMILFGGNFGGVFNNEIWSLDLSGTPRWTRIVPAGTSPTARLSHRAVYDPSGDRMIVFGGFDTHTQSDLWSLSLSGTPTWTRLLPSGPSPGVRHGHSLIFDSNRVRLVLFGGLVQESGFVYDDLWELPLAAPSMQWRMLAASGGYPVGRYSHFSLFDPVQDRMLVSGGFRQVAPGQLNDVFRLQWYDEITAAATALLSVDAHADCVTLRWSVRGDAGTPARIERQRSKEVWTTRERVVLDGSEQVSFADRDVHSGERLGYRLVVEEASGPTTSATTWVDVPSGARLELFGFEPNPAFDRARVAFSLPNSGPATLELLDVTGRRVAEQAIAGGTAGRRAVELIPDAALAPGLYFIRLQQGGRTLLRRGTVMR